MSAPVVSGVRAVGGMMHLERAFTTAWEVKDTPNRGLNVFRFSAWILWLPHSRELSVGRVRNDWVWVMRAKPR